MVDPQRPRRLWVIHARPRMSRAEAVGNIEVKIKTTKRAAMPWGCLRETDSGVRLAFNSHPVTEQKGKKVNS